MNEEGKEVEFCSFGKFEQGCKLLVKQMEGYNFNSMYPIPRGGLPIAARLSHLLDDLQVIADANRINYDTLIVDDISDTGKTLEPFYDHPIGTLYYKKDTKVMPDFRAFEKTNKWIKFWWELEI
jgi:hypoxanthine phosphoribosyltransferase